MYIITVTIFNNYFKDQKCIYLFIKNNKNFFCTSLILTVSLSFSFIKSKNNIIHDVPETMTLLLTAGWVVTPFHEDLSQLVPLDIHVHLSHTMHPTQSVPHLKIFNRKVDDIKK